MALSEDIVTRITGFTLFPGQFNQNTPNLPPVIAINAEANEANQAALDPTTPTQIYSVADAAAIGGWGSPIYQAAKEIFPNNQGIPVWVYPQAKAVGAAAKVLHIAATGTATNNGTHFVVLCGLNSVGGQSYAVNILSGDTASVIHSKITDAVNNVLGAPCSATSTDYYSSLTAKWKGLTSDDINVYIDTNGNDLGITYSVTSITSGSGTPDISASLTLIGNKWITHIVNGYGLVDSVCDAYESFNGRPVIGNNPPTGRYLPTVFKPFVAFSGSVSADPSAFTDARLNDLTIQACPAPLSKRLPIEIASLWCLLSALKMQLAPNLDIIGSNLPGVQAPDSIGAMSSWENRDTIVKKGCSTVDNVAGAYEIQDPVTTYHPVGENPPQFRYTRNLFIDWNTRFTYMLLENIYVLGKTIVNDGDQVASNVEFIKPKIWKAQIAEMANQMVLRGLWVDAQFTIDSIQVSISTTNPDRFKTSFKYKRSGVVRQSDTDATAGFNVGTLTVN